MVLICSICIVLCGVIYAKFFSLSGKERKKQKEIVSEIPLQLKVASPESVFLGREKDLELPVYLPDSMRSRHVHILGATGSGKTESVILNFLKQDISRGYGSIVLDAK
ncbi:MAG: ATP-binding protein, partial [Bdellovibrionales bacterium]|nr:ATP-binding protein [Bdellovibrionales bacterium]